MLSSRHMKVDALSRDVNRVFMDGPVVTVDTDRAEAESVALRDGRIVAVGSASEVQDFVGPATERINLGGRTLPPGSIDAHMHSTLVLESTGRVLYANSAAFLTAGVDRDAPNPPAGRYVRGAGGTLMHDRDIGSIEIGTFADFVLLEDDPRASDPTTISKIVVSETRLAGRVCFSR